ncbi:hypothetical protein Dimus_023038 [Dionaea muscipula]
MGHSLNATAGTCEEMIKRAAFARELGDPIIMHDYLTGGFTTNTSLAHYCRDNSLLLHTHRTMHAVIDRQKNHGMHFRVLAKAICLSGGDHILSGTVVGKLKGERDITLGFVDLLRDDFIEKDRARGRDLAREGNEIIRKASKWSPELAAACELWAPNELRKEKVNDLASAIRVAYSFIDFKGCSDGADKNKNSKGKKKFNDCEIRLLWLSDSLRPNFSTEDSSLPLTAPCVSMPRSFLPFDTPLPKHSSQTFCPAASNKRVLSHLHSAQLTYAFVVHSWAPPNSGEVSAYLIRRIQSGSALHGNQIKLIRRAEAHCRGQVVQLGKYKYK